MKRRRKMEVRLKFLPTCECFPLTPTIQSSLGFFILCKECRKGYRLVYDITMSVAEKFKKEEKEDET